MKGLIRKGIHSQMDMTIIRYPAYSDRLKSLILMLNDSNIEKYEKNSNNNTFRRTLGFSSCESYLDILPDDKIQVKHSGLLRKMQLWP